MYLAEPLRGRADRGVDAGGVAVGRRILDTQRLRRVRRRVHREHRPYSRRARRGVSTSSTRAADESRSGSCSWLPPVAEQQSEKHTEYLVLAGVVVAGGVQQHRRPDPVAAVEALAPPAPVQQHLQERTSGEAPGAGAPGSGALGALLERQEQQQELTVAPAASERLM